MKATLLLFATAISSVSATLSWQIDTPCGGPFSDAIITILCDGDNACELGDTATVSGSVNATGDFDNENVIIQPCVNMNVGSWTNFPSWCPEIARKDAGKICDILTPASGQSCGKEGYYTVIHEEEIPENDDVPASLESFVLQHITVHVIIGDGDGCSIRSGYFTTAYSMMGLASLALAGAACAAKRRVKAGATDDEASSSFVEMKDVALV